MTQKNLADQLRQLTEFSFLAAIFILPFAKAGFEILFGLTLIFLILTKILNRQFNVDHTFLIICGLLIVCSSISVSYSGYPELSGTGILKLVKYILVMFVAIDLFSSYDCLKRLLWVGLISLILVLLDSLIQNLWGKDLILGNPIHYPNEQIRLTGPYQSYGLLAAQLIASIPISLTFLSETKKTFYLKRSGFGFLLLITFYVLYQTQSRGGWLAALGSLVVYSFLTRNKWYFIILAIALFTAPLVLPKKVLFHLDFYNREASLVERKLLWKRAISVIQAEPWFGCGINTYTKNYPQYAKGKEWDLMKQEAVSGGKYADFGEKYIPGHPKQIPGYYVHNGYLQTAAETGLVSLALFLMIIGFSFRSGFQALKKSKKDKKLIIIGLICGLVALLLQAFVDTTLHNLQSAVFIWLFLGLLVAVNHVRTKQ